MELKGLKELVEVRSASGNEGVMKDYLLDYIQEHSSAWKVQPQIIEGDGFQDAMILIFGEPRTAVFSHMDSIGFMVGYNNELLKIGGPRVIDGTDLVGTDSKGEIDTEMMVIEDEDGNRTVKLVSDRIVDRGTQLTFKPNYMETDEYVQSPYMDNRLGLWVALELCKTVENAAIVFSTYEEQGGGSVGFLGNHLINEYNVRRALICDITWITEGIEAGKGVAISLHDKGIPRRSYVNHIIDIANKHKIKYQLEVESAGGSDGTMLQQTDLAFDWCFIGAGEENVHSPTEKVQKADIQEMLKLYQVLLDEL